MSEQIQASSPSPAVNVKINLQVLPFGETIFSGSYSYFCPDQPVPDILDDEFGGPFAFLTDTLAVPVVISDSPPCLVT